MKSRYQAVSIGIYEAGAHEQYLHDICRIATGLEHEITVFTTQDKYKRIISSEVANHDAITWLPRSDDVSVRSHLKKVQRRSTQFDALLFVSIYGRLWSILQYALLDLSCPTLLYIYNINTWYNNSILLRRGIRTNLRRKLNRRIRRKMDAVVVEFPQMLPAITERYNETKPVQAFAPVVWENPQDSEPVETPIIVTVPGNVGKDRRDYETLLDGIEVSFYNNPEGIELRLVGPPIGEYGQRIQERCEGLSDQGLDVKTFDHRLNQKEFEHYMRDTDLMICPLRYMTVGATGEVEIYGVSKGSGSVFDAIRYGSPVVYPEHFPVPGWIRTSSEYYRKSSDISRIVDRFVTDIDYRNRMVSNARDNASEFILDRQADALNRLLSTVTS